MAVNTRRNSLKKKKKGDQLSGENLKRWKEDKKLVLESFNYTYFRSIQYFSFLLLFFFKFEREHKRGGGSEKEGEADSVLSREPNVGPNSRTLGS